ncbi:vesicle coat component [Thelotrema lepadinum]|nr:vesicle coat component [Thelotrema lepadinum]
MDEDIIPSSATWNPALRPDSDADLRHDDHGMGESNEASKAGNAKDEVDFQHSILQKFPEDLVNGLPDEEYLGDVAKDGEKEESDFDSGRTNGTEDQVSSTSVMAPPNSTLFSHAGIESDIGDAWGIDPDLKSPKYTNSFPVVPPQNHLNSTAIHPLAHSQAGNLMQEVAEEQDNIEDEIKQDADFWSSHQTEKHDEDDFFSKTQTLEEESGTPPDEEARFEEGLPLVSPEPLERNITEEPVVDVVPEPFGSVLEADVTENFFSQLGKENTVEDTSDPPRPLERKSTEQVLHTMNLASSSLPQTQKSMDAIFEHQPLPDQMDDASVPEQVDAFEMTSNTKEEDLAALWQAALGDDEILEDEVDPGAFFGDENEGFLEEPEVNPTTSRVPSHPAPTQYAIQPPQQPFQSGAPLGATMQSPYLANNYGAPSPANFNISQSTFNTQPTRPAIVDRTQSFADKSKGGYSSPYDAPMDISRPKRLPPARNVQMMGRGTPVAAPPPRRSDSLQSNSAISVSSQLPYVSSPTLSQDMPMDPPHVPTAAPNAAPSGSQPRPSSSGFFEDLPSLPKPRTSSFGRFAQQMPQQAPPPPIGFSRQQPQQAPLPPPQAPPAAPAQQIDQFGLVGPERVLPFSDSPQPAPTQTPSSSSAAGRYSPGPQGQTNQTNQSSAAASKYSGPPGSQIPRAPSVPHQYTPHRPSPLARSASVSQQYRPQDQVLEHANGVNEISMRDRRPSLKVTQTYAPNGSVAPPGAVRGQTYHHPLEQSQVLSPDTRTFDSRQAVQPQTSQTRQINDEPDIYKRPQAPPRRPPSGRSSEDLSEPFPAQQQPSPQRVVRTRTKSTNEDINFIPPEDGREHDPLRRWQGAPILCWGFGGTMVTSFPQRIPRYAAGQRTPLVKCGPGGIKVQSTKLLLPEQSIASFPGPLKSKSKKKEALDWLHNSVGRLEQEYAFFTSDPSSADRRKRHEEKILLFKILAVFVECDGAFESNANAGKSIRSILTPEVAFEGPGDHTSYESVAPLSGIIGAETELKTPVTPSSSNLEPLRRLLLRGDREKAVWYAVDQKLWGHAMIIGSTLPPEVGKQVAQDFVRNEVKSAGRNTESLAALYDVFCGNWEESIDQLVPPSARAGLQMMSKKASAGQATNALAGLDRWRETLSLILSNRSRDDPQAMVALGQLLARYGRYEAAHTCFLFSKLPGLFGGPDDPQTSMVLLGADHRQQGFDYGKNIDSLLLTEIYEFLFSTLSSSTPAFALPHLQAFKLYHAELLAEQGLRDEAQQYCDTISAALKGTTKISPYFHPRLFTALEELNFRLRQSPKDNSGSWISKPSMDKVSGSVWNKFTQFVAGDDADDSSVASGKADTEGPFARISGDTPPIISRGPSPASGAYASYTTGVPAISPNNVNSRYAPSVGGSSYAPQPSERPNPLSQGYGLLPGSSTDIPRPQLHQPPQPPNVMYNSDSDRSLPTPPTMSKYSPEFGVNRSFNAVPPTRIQEAQMSPPSSDAGHSRPSTGQSRAPIAQENLLSPNETRQPAYQPSPTSDRYSPGYGPRSASSYGPRSSSLEPRSAVYEPMSATSQPRSYLPSPGSERAPPTQPTTYEPSAPLNTEYFSDQAPYTTAPITTTHSVPEEAPLPSEAKPVPYGYEPPSVSGYDPPASSSYDPVSTGYEPVAESGYAPSSAGYEPPSYAAEPSDDLTSSKSPRKKKSFMDLSDDEEGFMSRAAGLTKKAKPAKSREPDDAVRRAAEEDAKRDKAAKASGGGWFGGGWFGGGKAKESAAAKQEAKAHQIKFGEENAFYYDKGLNKWVNKNADPDAAGPSGPKAPPPKGPPSRAVSSAALPPNMARPPPAAPTPPLGRSSGPPTRNVSPNIGGLASPSDSVAEAAATSAPSMIGSGPQATPPVPPGLATLASGLAPPSRPGTGMSGVSTTSSIDDLIGAPQQRKGGTVKKSKKGRGYVDVMASKS